MRKNNAPRKLNLSTETLLVLTNRQLALAAGGVTFTCTEPTHSVCALVCNTGVHCG